MKYVVKTNEVPHLWAHQTQESARNGRNFYFTGEVIYSYGSHFPIARHVKNKKGERAILFTTRTHSVTTAKHLHLTREAIPELVPVFNVYDVFMRVPGEKRRYNEPTPANGVRSECKHMVKQALEYLAKSKRARCYAGDWLAKSQGLLREAQAFADFFGVKFVVKTPADLEAQLQKVQAYEAQQLEKIRKREAQAIADAQNALDAWKAGANTYEKDGETKPVPSYFPLPFAYARIELGNVRLWDSNPDSFKELVTTQGARIPLDHACRVWPTVKAIIEQGRTYKRNGHTIRLGHYSLDKIMADGTLKAGCHTFEKAEVLRIGALLEACPQSADAVQKLHMVTESEAGATSKVFLYPPDMQTASYEWVAYDNVNLFDSLESVPASASGKVMSLRWHDANDETQGYVTVNELTR